MTGGATAGRTQGPTLDELAAMPPELSRLLFGMEVHRVFDDAILLRHNSPGGDAAGGWEPIGDDVTPTEPPPVGTKRWLEALAQRHTGVAATARHARPGVVLIELAGEPSAYGVDMFLSEATLGARAAIEVTWTQTVDGPVWA